MTMTTPEKLIKDKGECPFCGSRTLYDQYIDLDGFREGVIRMYATTEFDSEILAEMSRRKKAFQKADSEAHERETSKGCAA